ncbi:MAG: Lrp/AsnC family transcriptional regulator [Caldilineales bacterium]
MVDIDDIDRKILQALQQDGRITNAELARQIALSPPAVYARLRRLEEIGLIQHYTALLNREALGYDLLCLINISMERHRRSDIEAVRKAVQDMNEVLECHHVTGEFDYQLKVVVRNRAELEQFVLDRLSTIAGIAHIRTSLVFSEIKSTTRLDVKPSP